MSLRNTGRAMSRFDRPDPTSQENTMRYPERLRSLHGMQSQTGNRPDPSGEDGFALITVLLILVLLSGLTVVAHLMSRTEVKIGGNDYTSTRSFYAAEAGAESMLAAIRSKMADGVLTASEVDDADDSPPTIPGFAIDSFRAEMVGSSQVVEITQGPFSGLKSLSQKLRLISSVEGASGAKTSVEMNADALAIPIFQFAAFYNEDLEIFPGPDMDLTGRVHTNEELYVGNPSGGTLDFHDIITASGHLHQHRKHDPSEDDNTPDIRIKKNDGSWAEVQDDSHDECGGGHPVSCSESADETFVNRAKSDWDNNIQTKSHGIEPLRLPVPAGTDPYEIIEPCDGSSVTAMENIKFACNADVTIKVTGGSNPSGDLTVSAPGLDWSSVGNPGDVVWFEANKFYDDREQDDDDDSGSTWDVVNENSDRDVIELDVSQMDDDEYDTSSGGGGTIIYVTAEANGGTPLSLQQYVLRIKNGDELRHPLTIATDLPMYVEGDYNDEASGNWKPASLISDNITFLSECWTDSDGDEGSAPGACDTTVKAAIMSGHTPSTGPAAASAAEGGQFENFPRFLENWGGDEMEIVGSFVSMWYDRYSDSKWQWCCSSYSENYYSPPDRAWSFDDRFKDPANLPPGTPVVGQILRIGFIRTY